MDAKEFKNPAKEYRPSPFWSWNDKLDKNELCAQARDMKEKGFGGYFMHSRVGLATEYLSDEWMDCVRATVEEGKKLDMESWLYDEDKWPSGFAGGLVPARGDRYRMKNIEAHFIPESEAEPSLRKQGTIAAFQVILDAGGNIEEMHRVVKTEPREPRGVYVVFRMVLADKSNWYNGESYVDLLDPAVTEVFLQVTYDEYAKYFKRDFGEHLPGIFTDEPNFNIVTHHKGLRLPWTNALPGYFRKLNGYDIVDMLPLMYFKGAGCRKVRHDFWRTLTKRFVESYAKPCFERAERYGMKLTGHWLYEDNLLHQIMYIGAAMPHYEYEHVPGIDHLGRNINDPLTLKQVSSAAHQFGRNRVLCEIFGVGGHSMSFEDQKWIADFHFALGVTFMNQHLALYSMPGDRKRDYPPTFSPPQPYWADYKFMNDYFARCAYACMQGEFEADVLVLHPVATGWSLIGAPVLRENFSVKDGVAAERQKDYEQALRLFDESPSSRHRDVDFYNREFTTLLGSLLEIHRDFDLGDEIIMDRHGKISGKFLQVGKCRYRAVVVPPSITWSRTTADLIEKFAEVGGAVVFAGDVPRMVECEPNDLFGKLVASGKAHFILNEKRELLRVLDALIKRDVNVKDASGREISDIYYLHRIDDKKHIFFLSNKSRELSYNAKIKVRCRGRANEWDAVTGEVRPIPWQFKDGFTKIEAVFPPVGSRIIVVDPDATIKPKKARPKKIKKIIPIEGAWEIKRVHPNSMTLDWCRYAIDGGRWGELVPVWRARKAVTAAAGMEPYDGIQPWAVLKKGVQPKPVKVALKYEFESEISGDRIALVVEKSSRWEITVNGQKVNSDTSEWLWDKQFGKMDVTALVQKGLNTVEARCVYALGVEIEDAYLAGDFAVKFASPSKYVLCAEPAELETGNWVAQGYAFYAGSMVYRKKIEIQPREKGGVMLRLDNPRGTLFKIRVNGKELPILAFQPWEADISGFVKSGENLVEIEVVSSLRNTFGPLHNRDGDNMPWNGPEEFVDDGRWTDSYEFAPYGLLGGAEIVFFK
jgi:hypothetical protein